MANSWYIYNGVGDPFIPGSYNRTTITPNCSNGCKICAILLLGVTDPVPTDPFSANMNEYIINGIASMISQPSGLGQTNFVLLKNC